MSDSLRSGGILLYEKNTKDQLKVLIAHPGGPFFKNKDEGWWSIPKGEPEKGESMFDAALREFKEETGLTTTGPYINLGSILQKNRKQVFVWACSGTWSEGVIPSCNKITMEYPKGSGKIYTFPEIDKAVMVTMEDARRKLIKEQLPFIDRLEKNLTN
tara:strand:- start:133 stop:606 length:474 start_codon:yes stop_codon:yes gene_type:complete